MIIIECEVLGFVVEIEQLFQRFFTDRRLGDVTEALKRSNDIFDIIQPTENQHSKILAWLFNPREGHGQGDAILKDFLYAAYDASDEHVHANKQFFDAWKPSRIARTGFHGICLMPEFCLDSKKRLDLLMVDFDNQILLVVENKYGARYSTDQLKNYYDEVAVMLRQRPAFKGFLTAHIAVDRNYRRRQGDEAPQAPLNRWAYVDYSWLERGARRAEQQLERGNASASLVMAYCQSQTDYEPPYVRKASDTLAELVREYRPLVDAFSDAQDTTLGRLTPTTLSDDLWIYVHHHEDMVKRMIAMGPLAFLEPNLRRSMPDMELESYYGKEYVDLQASAWRVLGEEDGLWPLSVKVWTNDSNAEGAAQFGLALYYSPGDCNPEHADALQRALEEAFPELRKGRQGASYRTLGHVKSVGEAALEGRVRQLLESAGAAVSAALL